MKLFEILNRLITAIRKTLRSIRGEIDNELLEIPQQAIDSFARLLLPKIQAFFESAEGKQEFEQWKLQQAKLSAK